MNHKPGHVHAGLRRRVRAEAPRHSTRRASLVTAAAWPALAWAGAVFGQSKKPPVLIGLVSLRSREMDGHRFAALKEGLVALGWKEGSQMVFEERWADGQTGCRPSLRSLRQKNRR